MACARQRDFAHRGAHALERADGRAHHLLHAGLHALDEILARHGQPQALHVGHQRRRVVGHGAVDGGGVARVVARDGAQQDSRVRHVFGQRTDLIERGRKGDQAEA